MRRVVVTREELRKLPYYTTEVSRGKTIGEIIGMLEDMGITSYQFTKDNGEGLRIKMIVEQSGVRKEIGFDFSVPLIYTVDRRSKKEAYEEKVSWRIFYKYLEAKLAVIHSGIVEAQFELSSYIIYRLPSGVETTVGEVLNNLIFTDRLDKMALPSPEESVGKPKSISVDYKVTEG